MTCGGFSMRLQNGNISDNVQIATTCFKTQILPAVHGLSMHKEGTSSGAFLDAVCRTDVSRTLFALSLPSYRSCRPERAQEWAEHHQTPARADSKGPQPRFLSSWFLSPIPDDAEIQGHNGRQEALDFASVLLRNSLQMYLK